MLRVPESVRAFERQASEYANSVVGFDRSLPEWKLAYWSYVRGANETSMKWQSLETCEPPPGVWVVLQTRSGQQVVAFKREVSTFVWGSGYVEASEVISWCALPEAPSYELNGDGGS